MYEMIIFAIVLYLFITNSFIRVQLQDEGLFVIIKRREYIYDVSSGNYREEVVIKIKELYRFNNNNLPF
jgi:hypothetical protein|tara:strand:- start:56 stop:262 length:207 start_codon:yes stop_codon:yes gene_type:complete